MGKSSRSSHQSLIEAFEPRRLLSGVIYVDINATDPVHDGGSWTTAYLDLQQALAAAVAGDEIRVADGVYKPTEGTDRALSFRLKTGVRVLGGYAGAGAVNPDARDKTVWVTSLSGDIGTVGVANDNSMTVVIGSGVDATAELDGFTITAAGSGRGMSNVVGSPIISNCIFTACTNSAIRNSDASPTISNCIFKGNSGTSAGGAIVNVSNSVVTITDSEFYGNSLTSRVVTGSGGGAISADGSTLIISDCRFDSNVAANFSGGAISGNNSRITASHSEFTGNQARRGGAVAGKGGAIGMTQCTFTSNFATDAGAIYGAGGGVWTVSGCTFKRNVADDGMSGFGGAMWIELPDWMSTLLNCQFYGNRARLDGGAIMRGLGASNCAFVGNLAGRLGAAVYGASAFGSTLVMNAAGQTSDAELGQSFNNSILWRNSDPGYGVFAEYSDVDTGSFLSPNLNVDPMFYRNPNPGADLAWGTSDDDYGDLRLRFSSPLVDAGSNLLVPPGGVTDLAGNPRFQDLATVKDKGVGPAPVVDIGAYEVPVGVYATVGSRLTVATGVDLVLGGYGASGTAGALSYDWDFDSDGQFDDATGPNAVLPTAGKQPGSAIPISLRVTDAAGHSATDGAEVHVVSQNLYVDQRAAGANTGRSWTDAFTNLSAAMGAAGYGQTIKVAGGLYKPSISDRRYSFELSEGITLLGGFAGNAGVNHDERNVTTYPTILSGEIGNSQSISDNSFHVIAGRDLTSVTTLDGVTITAGYAMQSHAGVGGGGGLYVLNGNPTIRNCIFTENSAGQGVAGYGGAVYISGAATFTQCQFIRNRSRAGGAIWAPNTATVINCEFYANGAEVYSAVGGGSATLVGCTFVGNSGGACVSGPVIVNCTFASNPTSAFYLADAASRAVNVISWGNLMNSNSAVPNANITQSTIGNDPFFVRNPSPGIDGIWGTADDDYGDLRLRYGSPCFDGGDNSAVPAGVTTDLAGNPRFVDVPGQRDPGAIVDVGAYERVAPFADPSFNPDSAGPSVVVRFGFDVMASSLSSSDLVLKNLTTGEVIAVGSLASASYDPATHIASWTFAAALADGNYRATLPAGSVLDTGANPALGADLVFDFYALAGDANRDRKVDLADMSILSANWQGSGKTFSQGDFNYDGNVDAADLAILSSNWQKQLLITDIAAPLPARPPVRQPVRVTKLVL